MTILQVLAYQVYNAHPEVVKNLSKDEKKIVHYLTQGIFPPQKETSSHLETVRSYGKPFKLLSKGCSLSTAVMQESKALAHTLSLCSGVFLSANLASHTLALTDDNNDALKMLTLPLQIVNDLQKLTHWADRSAILESPLDQESLKLVGSLSKLSLSLIQDLQTESISFKSAGLALKTVAAIAPGEPSLQKALTVASVAKNVFALGSTVETMLEEGPSILPLLESTKAASFIALTTLETSPSTRLLLSSIHLGSSVLIHTYSQSDSYKK